MILVKKDELLSVFKDDELPFVEEYSYVLANRWSGYMNERAYCEFCEKHEDIKLKFHKYFAILWN